MKRCASNFHLKATQTTTSFYMVSISLSLSSTRKDGGGAGDMSLGPTKNDIKGKEKSTKYYCPAYATAAAISL